MPKLLTTLRDRYLSRPGGYTRILRSEPLKQDAAPSAILSLVDGPRDIRFAMTAKTLVRERAEGKKMAELTALNVRKVTRFREDGDKALEAEVRRLELEEQRVKREAADEFEKDGTTREWVEASGPGRVRQRRIKKDPLS